MKECWPLVFLLPVSFSCGQGDVVIGTRSEEAGAQRSAAIPIGIENVNNSAMNAANYRALLRFVPDERMEIDRFYFGFKLQGADCHDPGLAGNGAGDGGILKGRLVEIDPESGLPGEVIDSERINGCERYREAASETSGLPVFGWLNVSGQLLGGHMYGIVVENGHAAPNDNFFSFQMPIADTELAGPQARNELDPAATGSIMSLDPREHVAWSDDGGATWGYGSANGEYASYVNDDASHPATRIPLYGYRLSDGTNQAGQPYYAYKSDCESCTILYSARYARTLSRVGGFTASGTDVGTLTLTNLSTSQTSSCVPAAGYGFRICELEEAVDVSPGDDYSIASTGTVELLRMNASQRALFPDVGTPSSVHSARQLDPPEGSSERDVPSLWAGPLSPQFP